MKSQDPWPALAAGIAFGIEHRFPWFFDAIVEVHRTLLNFDAGFLVRPKSNTLDARSPAHWNK